MHALGFVFAPQSPRYIRPEDAASIIEALPPFVTAVGLFMDADEAEVRSVLSRCHLGVLQFHGKESPEFCERFSMPFLKAIGMADGESPAQYMARYPRAQGFLLDSHRLGQVGGTGETFDWDAIPESLNRPWLLAGGLAPDNVARAIEITHPYGVDVSSGIEAGKGIKDHAKMASFVKEVRRVERNGS